MVAPAADATQFLDTDTARDPQAVLKPRGAWVLANDTALGRVVRAHADLAAGSLDLSALDGLDTAGAARLCELLGSDRVLALLPPADASRGEDERATGRVALLRTVAQALSDNPPQPPAAQAGTLTELLARVGDAVVRASQQTVKLLGFMGLTLSVLARNLLRPHRWRLTAVVAQMEDVGLNAVPIVALLTFLVGAVIAFLGATVLSDFGATQYTVNLVGFSFLREFAVLLTAILMAGRSASAFAAQLGSMKVNEEIDALRVQGLDPMEMLVLPRVLAMLLALPMLTFVGMLAGLLGGGLVCAVSLDIPPVMFLSMLREDLELRHFLVGMGKAPIFAFLIALIGCIEGFKVRGSAQSVGQHTTSAVVQSIFVVILLDALAAMFFMEMGW